MANHTLDLNDEKKPSANTSTGDPRIGQKVLQYRILAEIGQGGMSVVYRGQDERLGRDVAIKVLHSFLAKNVDCRARLAREAKTVAKLQHPNILQVFDYSGEDEHKDDHIADLFIVTELVRGVTLKEFAERSAIHEIPELGALIVWETALALQHAHTHGVVHRDIKPENIMVRDDGVLKLMDFGIAQVRNQESLTVTGTLLGSPAHMAPESIEGKPSDHRADIFSLSTVLYWLVTGHLPFSGNSPHALLKAIVDGRFSLPQQLSARVSDGLSDVILQGMATDPEKRFRSAEEMAHAIANALADLGVKPNSNELKTLLAKPETRLIDFKKRTKDACFVRVDELKNSGETAKAMSLLGRILADDPQDANALQLLSGYEPSKRPRRWPLWLATSAVAIILTLTAVVSSLFENLRPPTSPGSDLKNNKAPTQNFSIKEPVEPPPTKAPTPQPVVALVPKPVQGENRTQPSVPSNTRPVTLTISPYADLYVDGKLVAKNASKSRLELPIGEHILTLKHEYAATEEKIITVHARDEKQDIFVALERAKPSALIVSSNVDADIALGGVYKGTTAASLSRPVIIPMPDKTHSINLDVIISKSGYEPKVSSLRFVAGQTKILTANLVPLKANSSQ